MAEVEALLDKQLAAGKALVERTFRNEPELKVGYADCDRWSAHNREILRQCFTGNALVEEYEGPQFAFIYTETTFHEDVEEFRDGVRRSINTLQGIRERIHLIAPEMPSSPSTKPYAAGTTIIQGDVYGLQQGSGNQQNVAQGSINVGPTIDDLIQLLNESDLSPADKEDAVQAAQDLQTMSQQDSPTRAERVRRRLDKLTDWAKTSQGLVTTALPLILKLRHAFGIP